ncbi:sulfatase family protein [Fundicoccus culcitae]|uniref:Sulfatase-like hydrolase/transferase n=1 Tax=Fundicoccus culcitae TaxID=2969821 RepID=A0ABY5P2S7_9LACT|nr:sulfatase [Fundicoccus culcitae]UUX33024.1 sulfatase-like hydrolase/transferase [Fundicoccus culcitae]
MRILLIDIDSLRPDHLSAYGYHRQTSPNIDQIAADGMKFTNYYTSDAPCLPSRSAFISSRFGIHNGVVNHGGVASEFRNDGPDRGFQDKLANFGLVGYLKNQLNLNTALVSPFAERHSAWHFYAGFNEIYNTGKKGDERADEITPVVMDWLKSHAQDDNWLLYVNYWDPHTPYRTPASYGNPFEDVPLKAFYTEELLAEHMQTVGPHTSQEIGMYNSNAHKDYPRALGKLSNFDDLKTFIDGYDIGIHYADAYIGKIIQYLKDHNLYEDTAIIITADHGENQGEFGIYAEHATADKPTTNIPLILKMPNVPRGTTNTGLHYSLDLLPTLAEYFGLPQSDYWDGESFLHSINNDPSEGRDELILSQMAHVVQRSVRFDDWLYIRTYHDGYHLFPPEMLYNVQDDPYEQNNVAEEHPEVVRDAVYRLMNWQDKMLSTLEAPYQDPMWTVLQEGGPLHAKGELPAYLDRLRDTGRGWAIEELRRRHPQEFNNK